MQVILALLLQSGPAFGSGANPVNLQSAANYQLLAGNALTIGAGTIGVQPEFDAVSTPAVADLGGAIAGVAGLIFTSTGTDLGGSTFTPGNYEPVGGAALAITSNITLDAQGNADSYFIFYTPAAMNTTAGIVISLANGAQAMHIYWVIGGAVTTGASGILAGTFMSSAAITTGASSTFSGCLLASAAVTIGAANILQECDHTLVMDPSGYLMISVPIAMQLAMSSDGLSASGSAGLVTVTDTRMNTGTNNWSVSVEATSLDDKFGNHIPATSISYSVLSLQISAPITVTTPFQASLSPAVVVATSTGAIGMNSASWMAHISLTLPPDQARGLYTGAITHSVS